jgi:hypothetical protein
MADEALKTGVFRAARYAELSAVRTRSRREIEACAPCSFDDGNAANRRGEHAKKTRQEKARPSRPGFFIVEASDRERLVRGRGKLRDQALVGLEGLLGEFGVETRDLLRFGDEGLVGRAREFGLRFDRLVH